jgi:hypothetical protein
MEEECVTQKTEEIHWRLSKLFSLSLTKETSKMCRSSVFPKVIFFCEYHKVSNEFKSIISQYGYQIE